MKNYKELIEDIIENGTVKEDRTGTGTISVFGKQLRWDMRDGFPLMTIKKVSFNNVLTELLWFLQGRTDLKYLLQHGNKIWVGDAYKRYEEEMIKKKQNTNLVKKKFKNKWNGYNLGGFKEYFDK